jgi:hypothetical protein
MDPPLQHINHFFLKGFANKMWQQLINTIYFDCTDRLINLDLERYNWAQLACNIRKNRPFLRQRRTYLHYFVKLHDEQKR